MVVVYKVCKLQAEQSATLNAVLLSKQKNMIYVKNEFVLYLYKYAFEYNWHTENP